MGSDEAGTNGAGDPDLRMKPPWARCAAGRDAQPRFLGGPRTQSRRSLSGPPAPADADVPALDFY